MTDTAPAPLGGTRTTPRRARAVVAGAASALAREAPGALGALLLYLTLALLLTADAWRDPTARWVGGCCDPQQSIWFLQWLPFALREGVDPLFTTMLNAPDGVNLMWNSAMTPLAALAAVPTAIGGPVFAYDAMIVLALAFDGWLAWLVLRRYAAGPAGPLVGGLVYAFSPYLVSHAAHHLNLTAAWAPPVFLLLLDELLVRRRRPPWLVGVGLGVVSALQLLASEEILATSVIAAGVLVLVLAACRPREIAAGARRLAPALAVATLTFLPLAARPLWMQFAGPQRITGAVLSPAGFSTDLLNLVLPTPYQLLAPDVATDVSRHFSGLFHEAGAYLGLPLLALLVVVAARRWSDLRIRVPFLVAVVMLVLSFGPYLLVGGTSTAVPMPWLPLSRLPLLDNVITARFALYAWLGVAVIVAVLVDAWVALPWRRAAPRLAVLAAALLLALPAPLGSWSVPQPAYFRDWAERGIGTDETMLVAPYFTNGAGAAPMVWAALAGDAVRMPEAYAYVPRDDGTSGYGAPPTQLSDIMEAIQDRGVVIVARGGVRDQVARDLVAADVRRVVVGPMEHQGQMASFFEDLLGRAPEEVGGVLLWSDVHLRGVAPPPD
ncbi:MAG: hypothetical protein MUE82_06275 [Chloroflexi bacterium]|nr:hypothetical protein [Chloroflexota bacterium]